jgi:hypothetical protein
LLALFRQNYLLFTNWLQRATNVMGYQEFVHLDNSNFFREQNEELVLSCLPFVAIIPFATPALFLIDVTGSAKTETIVALLIFINVLESLALRVNTNWFAQIIVKNVVNQKEVIFQTPILVNKWNVVDIPTDIFDLYESKLDIRVVMIT